MKASIKSIRTAIEAKGGKVDIYPTFAKIDGDYLPISVESLRVEGKKVICRIRPLCNNIDFGDVERVELNRINRFYYNELQSKIR